MIRFFITCVLLTIFFVCFCKAPTFSQDRPAKLDTSESDARLENAQMFFFFLTNRDVKGDLELAGEQVDKIEGRAAEIQKGVDEYRALLRTIRRDPDAASTAKKLQEEQLAKMSTQLELIRTELLPHQLKRMNQIAFQYEATKSKDANASQLFLIPKMVDELGISIVQRSKIEKVYRNRDERLRNEYEKFEKRFREIQQQAYREILTKLSADQRSEVEEHIGPPSALLLSPSRLGDLMKNK